jgi:hypothetical protein
MRFPRSLVFSLMMSMGIAPCVSRCIAQSPREFAPAPLRNPFVAQPLPGSRIPPMDFHVLTPDANNRAIRELNARTVHQLNPFESQPDVLLALRARVAAMKAAQAGIQMAMNNGRCYAIRDYRFSRVAPNSDATKLSGSSTCEPASQVRLKGTVVR